MIAPLIRNSEWLSLQCQLIRRHHLELADLFTEQRESWLTMKQIHAQQQTELANKPFDALEESALIGQQAQEVITQYYTVAANRKAIQERQQQEMADLDAQWGA